MKPDVDVQGGIEAFAERMRDAATINRQSREIGAAMGREILRFQEAMRRAFSTPGMIDLRSRVRYNRAIKYERLMGLAYVRTEAERIRRELGLDR